MNRGKNSKKISFYFVILVFIVIFGLYVRIEEYIHNRSVWFDEASLALNIINKSFWQLLTQPLDYNQAAPIGFVLLTKLIVLLLGNNEFVLRALPFACSILSLFLIYKLSLQCLSRNFVLLPIFLFATSIELLRYATEFKQYSSDILFSLIISIWALSVLKKGYNLKKAFSFGIIGFISIFFSFPSVFILAGIGVGMLIAYISQQEWNKLKNLSISITIWVIGFIADYFLFLKDIANNRSLESFWSNSFMPVPPYAINDIFWFSDKLVRIFYHPGMLKNPYVGFFVFIIGCYSLYKKDRSTFFMFASPLFFVLIVSALQKYPFEGRVLLFYVPFLYIFIAEGLSFLFSRKSSVYKIIGALFLISILFSAFKYSYDQIARNVLYREEIKPILDYIKENKEKEDLIYVYSGADRVFQYYLNIYGFDEKEYIKDLSKIHKQKRHCPDIEELKGKKRLWAVFTHVKVIDGISQKQQIIDCLNSKGTKIDYFGAVRSDVYLYEYLN